MFERIEPFAVFERARPFRCRALRRAPVRVHGPIADLLAAPSSGTSPSIRRFQLPASTRRASTALNSSARAVDRCSPFLERRARTRAVDGIPRHWRARRCRHLCRIAVRRNSSARPHREALRSDPANSCTVSAQAAHANAERVSGEFAAPQLASVTRRFEHAPVRRRRRQHGRRRQHAEPLPRHRVPVLHSGERNVAAATPRRGARARSRRRSCCKPRFSIRSSRCSPSWVGSNAARSSTTKSSGQLRITPSTGSGV